MLQEKEVKDVPECLQERESERRLRVKVEKREREGHENRNDGKYLKKCGSHMDTHEDTSVNEHMAVGTIVN